ncbi:unnamed protein product [Spirodela intermedia]|uniref:Uncharacterized protein n=1 Tax=Spirodela intermedia TaxID=51605 RepID=A0A7I8JMX9_SPIIN|nr:unnamed protein product [Spirodela intermedia]CAA6670943.1 unnamed protein product [Spirodela intermedia]
MVRPPSGRANCLQLRRDSLSSASPQEIWKPAWLEALDTQRFFAGCSAHEAAKKNEKNICCLDCCTSICPHCVRRYVYHDVVRLEDLERLIDCSYVQSYTINSSKVVFIKKRPQNRQFKGSGNSCSSCDRTLQEPYIHCSLGCKVDFLLSQNKDLSVLEGLRLSEARRGLGPPHLAGDDEDDDGTETTTQSTVVDNPSDSENRSSPPPITAEFVRRKRSGLHACCASTAGAAASMNRRKGTPHRSPSC